MKGLQRRIRRHIENLQGVRHPVADPVALEGAADYIRGKLRSYGCSIDTHRFTEYGTEYRNIVGSRGGATARESRVLVLAHYDTVSVSPGADDNASGVAVMLEAARVLRRAKLGSTIQFAAVCLEEQAVEGDSSSPITRGSRALAAHARDQAWQIDAAIVLESVAFAAAGAAQTSPAGLPVALPETGDFIAVVGNEDSRQLVEAYTRAVAGHRRIGLPVVPLVVPGNGEVLPDTRRSDNAPFWDEGYPAIMLTDTANFRNPNYHKPTDTIETLNFAFAADVCRSVVGLVADLVP